MDITDVILDQHAEQRRIFAMLEEIGSSDEETLGAVWKRLEILLETHAEAEERYFYPMLVRVGSGAADAPDMEEEVEDAVKDHNEIRHALRAVAAERVGNDAWWRAVTACNVANSDHMAEEERQDLTDFRRHASLEMRHQIAVSFVRYEALKAANGVVPEDKDPERYVEELEAKIRATS